MKKFLLSFLCLVICIAALCIFTDSEAFAAEIVKSGTCGDNLTWTLDSEYTLTISGEGDMWDYEHYHDYESDYYSTAPWYSYSYSLKKVIIEDGVTTIGNSAFAYCMNLTSVTLPDGVTTIGDEAFYYCHGLTNITLPDSVTSIGDNAFSDCYSLASITLPNSVEAIGDYAFYNCDSLTSITLPNSITTIGGGAFCYCWILTSITIPSSVTTIGDYAFYYCTSLKSITIPDGVTTIGDYAFEDCNSLTSITLPNSITTIGGGAFSSCDSLTNITLPDSITTIGDEAFSYCYNLEYAFYEGTRAQWDMISIGNSNDALTDALVIKFYDSGTCGDNLTWILDSEGTLTISGDGAMDDYEYNTVPWFTYKNSIKKVIIGDGVASIGDYAFSECYSLTSVTIPDSVTTIGGYAFAYCTSLTSITIPDSVTTIGDSAFSDCISLTSIAIPDGVTTIGDETFYDCDSLTTVALGDGVTTIGDQAFSYCDSLTSITIPDGVTSIGSEAFYYCESLTSITIPDSLITIGDSAFYNCTSLKSITIPDDVTSIGDSAFAGCDGLTSVTISDSVTTIGGYAFSWCTSLTSVTIPDSLTTIGNSAFSYCTSLTSITIPDSVTTIGDCAFEWCENLTSITLPDSVTTIGDYAFYNCNITKLTIAEGSKTVTSTMVICEDTLKEVVIPDSVTTIGDSAFYNCTSLKSITIPDSLITIGYKAFRWCESLTSITIPDSVTTISNSAFYCCYNLKYAFYEGTREQWNKISIGYDNDDLIYALVTIDDIATITTQPKSVVVSDGVTARVTVGATGNGLTYTWYAKDVGNSKFYKSTAYTTNTYSIIMTSARSGRQLYCVVTDQYGNSVKSNTVTITMGNVAAITAQPKSATAASGASARTTVKAVGDGLTYTWYAKDKGDSNFYKSSAYKTATYSVVMTEARDGRQVYCVVTDQYGNSVRSNTVTLSLNRYAKITTQPKSVTVEAGTKATVSVKATGDGLKYYWYFKNPGASKFTYTSSFTGSTYSVTLDANRSGRQVYCYVVDKYGNSVKSDVATITIGNFAKITTQPKSVTVADGKTAKTTVYATGDGLTYKWYFKNKGASKFSLTTSYKTNSYSVSMDASRDGRQVYCVITDKYGNSVTSNTVTLSMKHFAKITTQPKSIMVPSGAKATVTVKATGDGLTYKWYFKNPGATKFSYTSSFTGNTYSVALAANRSGRQVYCVVTDKYGNSVKSNTVTLTVGNAAKITTQPKSVTVTAGAKATVKVTAIGDGLTYKWYFKNPGATKFSYTSTFTGNTYSVALAANRSGRQVYCVVTDQYGNSVKSNTVTLYTK